MTQLHYLAVKNILVGVNVMSQVSKLKQSRNNWKQKSVERANIIRYQKKEIARIKNKNVCLFKNLQDIKDNFLTCQRPAIQNKQDLVYLVLQLFRDARIGFRAVSRTLSVLADYIGIKRAPCTQTIINWVTKLSIVRIQSVPTVELPPPSSNFNGWIYMIDASIGLGTGKILNVLALRADYHEFATDAPGFGDVRCMAVAVADSWTGDSIADFLKRVIAVTGRPTAYLKDGGADLHRAIRLLGVEGLSSPMIDDISHAVANLLKWRYQDHPMFQTFLSACSRVSAKLKQTNLACLAPPKVLTKARFMNLHRLIIWAAQLLKLSPPGRASKDSILFKLRECYDLLPSCKPFIDRFQNDVVPLLECQKIIKTKGLNNQTRAQCESLIQDIPAGLMRREVRAYLDKQLDTARCVGLEEIGMPISTDPIESLYGLGKLHGTGQIKDADRIALRLPALCGSPTREEARQVLGVSVAEYRELIAPLASLTKQRRDVLPNPDRLESLIAPQTHIELIPGPKNRSKNQNIILFPAGCANISGPPISLQEEYG
jgi:hypothetical protein